MAGKEAVPLASSEMGCLRRRARRRRMQTVSIDTHIRYNHGPRVNNLQQTAKVPCFHPMLNAAIRLHAAEDEQQFIRGTGPMHTWLWARATVLHATSGIHAGLAPAWMSLTCEPTGDASPCMSALHCHAMPPLFYQLFYRDSNPYLNAE